MTAPVLDPNVHLLPAVADVLCDADARRRYWPVLDAAATVRVYGDVVPGDDLDDLDVFDDLDEVSE